MINYIALLIALALSTVAGWYSIIGLTAIFSASFWPIVIMGTTLELAKVITASWLYRNWDTAPRMIRYYLSSAVCVLMFITSMGIFGYLSKAHIEQTSNAADNSVYIQQIDDKIAREQSKIDDAKIVINQLDKSVQVLVDAQRMRGPDGAIAVRESQKPERDQMQQVIDVSTQQLDDLQTQKSKLSLEQTKLEAEVGPLKYIAELVYGNAETGKIEQAVRWVIITLIFVFDPLAVLLLIAANMGLHTSEQKRIAAQQPPKRGRGRPKGSGKKKQPYTGKKRGRPRKVVEVNTTDILDME